MKDGIARAALRGTLASVAGVLAMDLYFKSLKRLEKRREAERGSPARDDAEGRGDSEAEGTGRRDGGGDGRPRALDDVSLVGHPRKEGEPSTVAVGRIAYEKIKGREPSWERGGQLGKAVHWGYGMAVGGIYGLLEPKVREHDLAAGMGYGTALWLLGDELAVPLLGLAEGPTAHPPRVHLEALGAHLVYGLTTSAATRMLHRVV